MSEWEQVGTVEVLVFRVYPIDPANTGYGTTRTEVGVEPGTYPVYRKFDAIRWMMTGRINERHAKLGDGLYQMGGGDKATGPGVTFSSPVFGMEEFQEFLAEDICKPGPAQRLVFNMEVSA